MLPSSERALRSLAQRLFLAALLSAILLALATAALSVTTAPALVSLLVEPFSLLLTPGFVLCLPFAGNHNEVSPRDVLLGSACFYFAVFSLVLPRWPWRRRTHSPSR